jgi:hypothetical protein
MVFSDDLKQKWIEKVLIKKGTRNKEGAKDVC